MGAVNCIAVWVSCGAASAVAALETQRKFAKAGFDIRYVNSPVLEEDPDNRRFMSDLQDLLGAPIETAINPKFPNGSAREIWVARRAMSFPTGAPCTLELKKEARYRWQQKNKPNWHVLGFTADEKKRHDRFILTELPNVIPILIEAGITKADCFPYLERVGLRLPNVYRRGYPNANCIGCVKATSPTYWNLVRTQDPAVFADRANQSRELGVKLARHKGKRVFLDELSPNAKGRPLTNWSIDCGIFCEEPP